MEGMGDNLTTIENLQDAHVFSLPSQGNIYTLSKLEMEDHSNKLLVGSINRQIFYMEFLNGENGDPDPVPKSQDLQLTYIPSGAEVVSLDAFKRSKVTNDYVIGITIVKTVAEPDPSWYLNIYSDWEQPTNTDCFLENLSGSCQSVELDFVPYQLTHCRIPVKDNDGETVLLLCGSDNRVHLYIEDKLRHTYVTGSMQEYFPELQDEMPSIVQWLDFAYLKDGLRNDAFRYTVAAGECGLLTMWKVDVSELRVLQTWTHEFEGPLTSAKFFYLRPPNNNPPSLFRENFGIEFELSSDQPDLNLVVGSSLSESMVYHKINSNGLDDAVKLRKSVAYDIPTCVEVADIDLDGWHEILLGTYGQELLIYKFVDDDWQLIWSRSFPAPILSMDHCDLTGDGIKELVVMTTRGLQILQHDLADVRKICFERLQKMLAQKKA